MNRDSTAVMGPLSSLVAFASGRKTFLRPCLNSASAGGMFIGLGVFLGVNDDDGDDGNTRKRHFDRNEKRHRKGLVDPN